MLVDEVDREAVEPWLGSVLDDIRAESLAHPLVERGQFLVAERIVQREHGRGMAEAGHALGRRRADPLGGRVRGHELRMSALERLERAEQAIVRPVGDDRTIEHVVAVVVLVDLPTQLGGAAGPRPKGRSRAMRLA